MIIRLEGKSTDMPKEEVLLAFKAQQQELDSLILEYASMEVDYADTLSRRAHVIMNIVENSDTIVDGVTNREDRLRAVQHILHQAAVNFVYNMILDKSDMKSSLRERFIGFINFGNVEFPFLDNQLSRVKIVREAWSQAYEVMDDTLSRFDEQLNQAD